MPCCGRRHRRYFIKHFRAGLHHCLCGIADLSLDCKIPFKTVLPVFFFLVFFYFFFFLAVNLVNATFCPNPLYLCYKTRQPAHKIRDLKISYLLHTFLWVGSGTKLHHCFRRKIGYNTELLITTINSTR